MNGLTIALQSGYYPGQKVELILSGNTELGIVESWGGRKIKAYSGAGFRCKFLATCRSRAEAIKKIVERAADL